MKIRSHELDRVVLEAVSDDYLSFESLVSKLSQSKFAQAAALDIERLLLTAISNHLVSAYLLHADPPYATEVGANPETIRRYWFSITEEGREYLRRLPAGKAAIRRRPDC